MKILRRIILVVAALFALLNLGRAAWDLVTLHWISMTWALIKLAIWAGICVYIIRQEKSGGLTPPGT